MLETSSNEVQSCASKCSTLGGSSGNDFSLLHFLKINTSKQENCLMVVGKFSRLLSDKSNMYNKDNPWRPFCFTGFPPTVVNKFFTTRFEKPQISSLLRDSRRQTRFSQLSNINFSRPIRLPNEDGNSFKAIPQHLHGVQDFWENLQSRATLKCECLKRFQFIKAVRKANKLFTPKTNKIANEDGNSFKAVPLKSRSHNISMVSMTSGKIPNLEQPLRLNISRGRQTSFLQFSNLNCSRPIRLPNEDGNSFKIPQHLHGVQDFWENLQSRATLKCEWLKRFQFIKAFFNLNCPRPIRLPNEDGNSFKAVPLKSRSHNISMVSMTSGKISNLEQPLRLNISRGRQTSFLQFFNLNCSRPIRLPNEDGNSFKAVPLKSRYLNIAMLSGRQTRFSQLSNIKYLRPIRLPNEYGNSFKAVPLKSRSHNISMVSMTSGKISNLEQPLRLNISRRRQTSFLQFSNLNCSRPIRLPNEDGNSFKAVPLKSRYLNISMEGKQGFHSFSISIDLRSIRLSIEDGNSFKLVPPKSSSINISMVSMISGKISNLEQPLRLNLLRDFNL
ncbi:hypothetical protein CXB51_029121 [Gossypium anomalum]|uniref:Uncharacterized protein n=1 Tax=Gossypium anomalum TaxID=47600 RepID=A0A8J6CP13_9ROSI|nr:hypothetical protein CXB51_029121 [Gossypium anomalum]